MADSPALLQRRVVGEARPRTDLRPAAHSIIGRGSLANTAVGNHQPESPPLTGHDLYRSPSTTLSPEDRLHLKAVFRQRLRRNGVPNPEGLHDVVLRPRRL